MTGEPDDPSGGRTTAAIEAFHRRSALSATTIAATPDAVTARTDRDTYPSASTVDQVLPAPARAADGAVLLDALADRRSRRQPPSTALGLDTLGWLLHHAARARPDGRRTHPSAGADYPSILDVVALRCEGLSPGVHRYLPHEHGVRTTRCGDLASDVAQALGRAWVREARAVLTISADLGAIGVTHGVRGYRYALLEAGHVAQSVLLLAAAAQLPVCPIGGFADQELEAVVDAGDHEGVLYALVL